MLYQLSYSGEVADALKQLEDPAVAVRLVVHTVNVQHPKTIGDRSTLTVMLALQEAGFDVLLPFGENTRYDLVIDNGLRLGRVQCKTGRFSDGAVRFRACSSYQHHARPQRARRDYLGEIDFFGVYCPETQGVYLVPIADAPVRVQGALRVDPPRNGQVRRIRPAQRYQVATVSVRATGEPRATAGA